VLELLLCIATWHALPCLPLIAPYLPLCHSLTISPCLLFYASVWSLVCLCVLSCLFYVHCCLPLCAPLSPFVCFLATSMSSLVDLCVLPCLSLCDSLSTSVHFIVSLALSICLAELAHGHGHGHSWMLKLHAATAIFWCTAKQRGTSSLLIWLSWIMSFLYVCSAGHPIFCVVISIRQLSWHK